MGPKSLFNELQLKDSEGGVMSSKLNRFVLSISGVPVNSVEACRQRVLKILDNQCILLETTDSPKFPFSSDWTEMVHNDKKYYLNTKTQARQWECPRPKCLPLALRKVDVLHAPGYFSGSRFSIRQLNKVIFSYALLQAKTFARTCAPRTNLCGFA
jgi:hypothetical protein